MADSITMPSSVELPPQPQSIPPLKDGDRLSRAEFERRYDAMPHLKKAELIEGVVHMPSPVSLQQHGLPHFYFIGWLAFYQAHTLFLLGGDNTTIRLDLDNEPQPAGILLIDPARGGKAQIDEDGYLVGSPEWAGEIAASSARTDLGPKMIVYRRNGVQEYVVWRVLERAIDWLVLRGGDYDRLGLSREGYFQSEVFPGLWLDPDALLRGDMLRVYQVLQEGLRSSAHAEFVARLRQ